MMKKIFTVVAVLAVTSTLAGCASTMLQNDRLLSVTANTLGVGESDLTITNRRTVGLETYYIATTKREEYACVINGGNILTMGMVNPPMCKKKEVIAEKVSETKLVEAKPMASQAVETSIVADPKATGKASARKKSK